ncbi:hypothetical protein AVEN_211220-1 [Araneus ventricosus]|uniref:HTH CENPB-type domain-containing protein n=1 Tax=Araneus ventricosus TaxID=182803 RepID=A0A4Y2M0U9_ARAVE|nr:hypothetical protein AVEN_211220-1 [Araneus ventricosus]
MKTSTYEDLDKAMVLWFNQQTAAGIPVSGAVCAAKAKHFFEEHKIPFDFNATKDLRNLDCSENVDEAAVEQWINEDSTLECCEDLSDDDIVFRVTCGSEEARNFVECSESDEENLVTHQKLNHDYSLVQTEELITGSKKMKAHL